MVQAGGKGPREYNGTVDAWRKIAANEGSKAFFKVTKHVYAGSACDVCYCVYTINCSGTCLHLTTSWQELLPEIDILPCAGCSVQRAAWCRRCPGAGHVRRAEGGLHVLPYVAACA